MSPKGIVDHMKIPSVYGEESPILLTHEFIHILKDTNIKEYSLIFKYSEIIPLLYEIIEYNKKEPSIRTSLIRNRYIEIRQEISTLIQTIQLINKDPYNKDKYIYVLSQAGKEQRRDREDEGPRSRRGRSHRKGRRNTGFYSRVQDHHGSCGKHG